MVSVLAKRAGRRNDDMSTQPTSSHVFADARERAKVTRQPGVWTDGRVVVVADRREGCWKYDVGTHAARHGYGPARAMAPVLDSLLRAPEAG